MMEDNKREMNMEEVKIYKQGYADGYCDGFTDGKKSIEILNENKKENE